MSNAWEMSTNETTASFKAIQTTNSSTMSYITGTSDSVEEERVEKSVADRNVEEKRVEKSVADRSVEEERVEKGVADRSVEEGRVEKGPPYFPIDVQPMYSPCTISMYDQCQFPVNPM